MKERGEIDLSHFESLQKPMKRSDFLKLTGATAGMYLLSSLPLSSKVNAADKEFSFAILADTHTAPYEPKRSQWLKDIFNTMLAEETPPEFVLHVGDLVEAGLPAEYAEFASIVPPYYQEKLFGTKGNHEVRWDEYAGDLFEKHIGRSQYSFDFGGIHFIALDPTQLLQEPGYITKSQLDWLKNDLSRAGKSTPIVMYLHYPIGDNNYYIINQGELFEAIERYNVRAVFTGHVHQEKVWKQNGLYLFSLAAAKSGPFFQMIKKRQNAQGESVLEILSASVENGVLQTKPLVQVPLTGPRPAVTEQPLSIKVKEEKLEVKLHPHHNASTLQFQFWPDSRYAGKDEGLWQEMNPTDTYSNHWEAHLDMNRPPGEYLLQVRVLNYKQSWWDSFIKVRIPDETMVDKDRTVWESEGEAPIQGGLAAINDEFVISASTSGLVTAIHPNTQKQVWAYQTNGSIVGTPQVKDHFVYVGSGDKNVYGLDGLTGKVLWIAQCPEPVLGSLFIKEDLLFVPSGSNMLSINRLTGEIAWQVKINGFTAGQPSADHETVYFGAGDGFIYAVYHKTGIIKWKKKLVEKENPYRTLIYSAWATHAAVVPDQPGQPPIVLVSNVTHTFALNRSTGAILWQYAGGYLYSAPLLVQQDKQTFAVLADEWGGVSKINPYSGERYWKTATDQRIFNASPIQHGELIFVTGVNGLLTALKMTTGEVVDRFHFAACYAYSTPVIVKDRIIQAAQDGIIRSLTMESSYAVTPSH